MVVGGRDKVEKRGLVDGRRGREWRAYTDIGVHISGWPPVPGENS